MMTMTTRDEMIWHLARLSGELAERGHSPQMEGCDDPVDDPVPRLRIRDLDVRVSAALVHGEWWFWWGLFERLTPCCDVAAAADRICGVEVAS